MNVCLDDFITICKRRVLMDASVVNGLVVLQFMNFPFPQMEWVP